MSVAGPSGRPPERLCCFKSPSPEVGASFAIEPSDRRLRDRRHAPGSCGWAIRLPPLRTRDPNRSCIGRQMPTAPYSTTTLSRSAAPTRNRDGLPRSLQQFTWPFHHFLLLLAALLGGLDQFRQSLGQDGYVWFHEHLLVLTWYRKLPGTAHCQAAPRETRVTTNAWPRVPAEK